MPSDATDLKWGAARVRRIVDIASETFAASDIFPDATPEQIRRHVAENVPGLLQGDPPKVELSFFGSLVRLGEKILLIDTCCGHEKQRLARPGWHMRRDGPFLENLAQAGVTLEDIDFVMCTHMHADHVGWNTRLENGTWVPTFPNARYVFSEAEYRHWQEQYDKGMQGELLYGAYVDSVLPVIGSGQAEMVEPGHSPCSGVHLEPAYGHTPGNSAIHVESESKSIMFLGDVLHHRMQIADPDLNTRFCWDPETARQTRLRLLATAEAEGALIAGGHFIGETYGTIYREGGRFRFHGVA